MIFDVFSTGIPVWIVVLCWFLLWFIPTVLPILISRSKNDRDAELVWLPVDPYPCFCDNLNPFMWYLIHFQLSPTSQILWIDFNFVKSCWSINLMVSSCIITIAHLCKLCASVNSIVRRYALCIAFGVISWMMTTQMIRPKWLIHFWRWNERCSWFF